MEDLGFVLYCENIWFKYQEINCNKIPHFVLTKKSNPKNISYIVKNLLDEETIITNSHEEIKYFVLREERNKKLRELLK